MPTATKRGPRVALTGGGTGGHIYPALAVAQALSRIRPNCEMLYVGGDRLEAEIVPAAGLPFRAISVHGIAGRGLAGLGRRIRALAELALGVPLAQSLLVLRGFRADVVVGTGGYVSGPVLLAGRLLGVPSLTLEGNRTPGWTSRAAARLVDAVAVAHPELLDFFAPRIRRGARVELTGLPLREEITTTSRALGAARLGLDPSLTTLLVLGGSLGSQRINAALLDALASLGEAAEWLADVQVVHITGRRYSSAASGARAPAARYRSLPYLDEQYADALAAADLVVSRAGASTVAEITARGLPAILIPWSQASSGEQNVNAGPLARAGAAVVIPDDELTGDRMASVLSDLLRDGRKRACMAEQSRRLGRAEAATRVAELALALAERRPAVSRSYDERSGGRSA